MAKAAKAIIYILVIAILTTILVMLILPGNPFRFISIIGDSITGDNYIDMVEKVFKAVEDDDEELYISMLPFDVIDYSISPYSKEDLEPGYRTYMPRLGYESDILGNENAIKDELTYTIVDVHEYSNDELDALIGTGAFSDIKHPIQMLVKLDVHLIYIERAGLLGEHTGELYILKVKGKWYVDPDSVLYTLNFIRPSKRGKIQIKPEYRTDDNPFYYSNGSYFY